MGTLKVWPIPHEPTRFMVESASGGLPWTVDLHYDRQGAACSCWVEYNRTDANRQCHHIRAVRRWVELRTSQPSTAAR